MKRIFELKVSAYELMNIAAALRESAGAAYDDERLVSAVMQYRMAGDYYAQVGNEVRACQCRDMAHAIDREITIIAAGNEEEVA